MHRPCHRRIDCLYRCGACGDAIKIELLDLRFTQVTDAGCATLVAALDSGALPALEEFKLDDIPASDAATDAVYAAMARSRARAAAPS